MRTSHVVFFTASSSFIFFLFYSSTLYKSFRSLDPGRLHCTPSEREVSCFSAHYIAILFSTLRYHRHDGHARQRTLRFCTHSGNYDIRKRATVFVWYCFFFSWPRFMAFMFTGKSATRERFMMNRAAREKKAPRKRVL